MTQDVKRADRMASGTIRKSSERMSYDGVVACLPVTIPYRRYSTNTAHWWVGRAVREVLQRTGLRSADIDGLSQQDKALDLPDKLYAGKLVVTGAIENRPQSFNGKQYSLPTLVVTGIERTARASRSA